MFCHQLKEESMLKYLSLCESPDFSFWLYEQKRKLGRLWWKVFHSQINGCGCFISTLLGIEAITSFAVQSETLFYNLPESPEFSFCTYEQKRKVRRLWLNPKEASGAYCNLRKLLHHAKNAKFRKLQNGYLRL